MRVKQMKLLKPKRRRRALREVVLMIDDVFDFMV